MTYAGLTSSISVSAFIAPCVQSVDLHSDCVVRVLGEHPIPTALVPFPCPLQLSDNISGACLLDLRSGSCLARLKQATAKERISSASDIESLLLNDRICSICALPESECLELAFDLSLSLAFLSKSAKKLSPAQLPSKLPTRYTLQEPVSMQMLVSSEWGHCG